MRSPKLLAFLFTFCMICVVSAQQQQRQAQPDTEGWPRKVQTGDYTLTVYQPELDSWDGFHLSGHYALSLQLGKDAAPTYGVAWVTADTEVDKDDRMVTLTDIQLTKVHFPSAPDKESVYFALIKAKVIPETKEIALDRLEEAAEVIQAENKASMPLKNDPPRIIFSSVPAILIYVDGTPVYKPLSGIPLERIINTRALVVKDSSGKNYVHVFDGWLETSGLQGTWTVVKNPNSNLAKAIELTKGQVDLMEGKSDDTGQSKEDPNAKPEPPPSLAKGPVPKIYVATTPTELIVTEGQPNYVTIEGTDLLYVKNTTGHVFKLISNQKSYVLISGRWFSAATLDGPWTYVPANQLPTDFAKIPDDSPKENVKASVTGTSQSDEARIANSIPQTATVKRNDAKFKPEYDGQPQLKPIEGTSLQYVINSSAPIILVDKSYYAVDNAVWFVATSLNGPWIVAESVPTVIYSIPPSSPIYYVTYVKVYKSTPEVVYVGYTPGYYGTVVENNVVVYGTGYYYNPWIGSVWYGPPATYGFGVSITYTPWTGWAYGFGFGWAWGAATVGWGWGCYPWWGPMGYYAYPYYWGGAAWGYRGAAVWGPGGWAATTGNVYHRWGDTTAVTRRSGGYNAYTGTAWRSSSGMSYNSRTGTISAGQRGAAANVFTGNYAYGGRGTVTNPNTGNTISGGRVAGGNAYTGSHGSAGYVKGDQGGVAHVGDNVYASKDGNIYKRDNGSWNELNKNGSWNNVKDQNMSRNLDRQHYQPRANGNMRTNNYRAGGGYRGGGRRR